MFMAHTGLSFQPVSYDLEHFNNRKKEKGYCGATQSKNAWHEVVCSGLGNMSEPSMMPNSRPVCSTEASFSAAHRWGRRLYGMQAAVMTRSQVPQSSEKARILGPRSSAVTVGSSGQTVLKATLSRTQAPSSWQKSSVVCLGPFQQTQ